MAFKMNGSPFQKGRKKKIKAIDPLVNPNVFTTDPYSVSSVSRSVTDKKYHSGTGRTEGLNSKLTVNPEGVYTRTQVESSPAFKMKGPKFYGDRSRKEMRQDIREERKSLKEGGATREEVKEYNQYQRGRKKDIRLDVRINEADRKEQEARDSGKTRKEKRLADKGARLSSKKT